MLWSEVLAIKGGENEQCKGRLKFKVSVGSMSGSDEWQWQG